MTYTGTTSPSFLLRMDQFISQHELENNHQQNKRTYNEVYYSNYGKCLHLNHAIKLSAGGPSAMVMNAFIDNGREDIADIDLSLLRVCKDLVEESPHISFNLTELSGLRERMEKVDFLFSSMAKAYYLIVMNGMVTLQAYARGPVNELVIRSSYYIGLDSNASIENKQGAKTLVRFYELLRKNATKFNDEQQEYVRDLCNDFVFINSMTRRGAAVAMDYLDRRCPKTFSLKFLKDMIEQPH